MAAIDFYLLAVVGLMTFVSWIGSPRLRDLVATAVSRVAFMLSRTKRHGREATLARVFGPRLGARRRRAIVRRTFYHFWVDTFSLLPLRGAPGGRIVGVEHLKHALSAGRGAIFLVSNNWAGMSTLKRTLYAHGFGVHKVHAQHHLGGLPGGGVTWMQQRVIATFFDRRESAIVASTVTMKRGSLAFGRELAGCLRSNGIVCIASDGRLGRRFVRQSFLGIDEVFPTGAVTLARTSGAPLLPIFCLSAPGGTMRVVIEPPVAVPAALDREQGVSGVIARYVERLEYHARRHPSCYLNWSLVGTALPPATAPSPR